MLKVLIRATLVLGLCLGSACEEESDDDTTGDASVKQTSGPLLPWKEGNSWTYKVTGDGEQSMKTTTIGALMAVGGTGTNAAKMAHKVETRKGAMDQTISWQALEGERVLRYREQSFGAKTGKLELEESWEPGKLHVDGSEAMRVAGANWIDEYKETKTPADGTPPETKTQRDSWKVDGVNQTVTVPAGTFTNAVVFIKAGGSSQKTYWYVPGVGKVKETGGQTEELVEYKVAP